MTSFLSALIFWRRISMLFVPLICAMAGEANPATIAHAVTSLVTIIITLLRGR